MGTEHEQVASTDPAVDQDFTEEDFYSKEPSGVSEENIRQDAYQPPPGFKLIPEDYIGVEPTMYAMMLKALGSPQQHVGPSEIRVQMPQQPREEPDEVFHIRCLQQLTIGDIGYNFQRSEEFSYCPAKKYLEVGGDRYTTIRSFLNMWNAHFGARPDPEVRKKPFFLILNPQDCPPIGESLGKRTSNPRFQSDAERMQYEEGRGDASHRRVHMHGETGEYSLGLTTPNPVDPRDVDRIPDETMHPYRRPGMQNPQQGYDPYKQDAVAYREQIRRQAYDQTVVQPSDAQMELNAMLASRTPMMPARAGIVGPDGLTPRARMIKQMSGDQIQRPVQRQQAPPPIGGYEPQETVANFAVEQGVMGGGRIVSQIPGGPADEAIAQAQMNDQEALRLQGGRTRY